MLLARDLFALPWVEPATHTVLHPLDWRRRRTPRTLPRTVTWYDELANYEHSMVEEVAASVRFIDQHLAPAHKPCRVVLWSGLANPSAEVVRKCRELGCVNLNGGTYRWDSAFDSVGYVTPWGVQRDDTFQVYCGAANENVFDGFYTTTPRAFGLIHETLERTGAETNPRASQHLRPLLLRRTHAAARSAPRTARGVGRTATDDPRVRLDLRRRRARRPGPRTDLGDPRWFPIRGRGALPHGALRRPDRRRGLEPQPRRRRRAGRCEGRST